MPARRRPNTKLALRIARAQLRAIKGMGLLPASPIQPKAGPPKFVQCWAVHRGYSSFTQALDETGQVWQLHTVGKKVDGVFVPEQMWWEPLDMTRKPVGAGSPSRADKTKETA